MRIFQKIHFHGIIITQSWNFFSKTPNHKYRVIYPEFPSKSELHSAFLCTGGMGTLKNPTKCLQRWEPDRRFNFFFNPPGHLCAVTYITEISLHNKSLHLPPPSFTSETAISHHPLPSFCISNIHPRHN